VSSHPRVFSDHCVVIGERIVTPQALVHLVMKLRISPPKVATTTEVNGDVELENRPAANADDEARLDDAFLNSPKDVEDLQLPIAILGSAHAPLWPSVCYFNPASVLMTYTERRITSPVGGLSSPMLKTIGLLSLR
jgi:hypothetical protein